MKRTPNELGKLVDWETVLAKYYATRQRSFMVSNVCPSKDRGGRNIWAEDKEVLLPLAMKYGYKLLRNTGPHMEFVNFDFK